MEIIKKEIIIEEDLKQKLEIICSFCNTKPTIINGSIRSIDKTNQEYQNINELSIALNNVNDELIENKNKIKYLTESNNALNIRIDNLKENISKKDIEIIELKEENTSLK